MTMSNFGVLCGSDDLWNVNIMWYPPNGTLPDVTPCMENIALTWLPCASLWFPLLPYILYLNRSRQLRSPQSLTKFTFFKSVIPIMIAAVYCYELVSTPKASPSHFFSAILTMTTLVVSSVLVQFYRRRGQFTSGVLWIYWLLSLVAALVRCYIYYKRLYWDGLDSNQRDVIICTVLASSNLIGFILSSLSDASLEAIKKHKKFSPEVIASFPSFITYHWVQPVMSRGYKKTKIGQGIEREDLYSLSAADRMYSFYHQFEQNWENSVNKWRQRNAVNCRDDGLANASKKCDERTPLINDSTSKGTRAKRSNRLSLLAVMLRQWFPLMLTSWSCRVVAVILGFANPLCQSLLITYMESQPTDTAEPLWKGVVFCLLIFVSMLIRSVLWGLQRLLDTKVYTRMYSALMAAIYKKSLTISGEAKQENTTGEIVNLMSVDASRTCSLVMEMYVYVYVPVQTAISMYFLYQLVGNTVFAGLAIIILGTPVSLIVSKFQHRLRKLAMEVKDERIRMMNETLNAIKVIKLYAWEPSFHTKICALREKETRLQRKINTLQAVQSCIYDVVPVLVTVVIFSVYSSTQPNHILSPSVAFVTLTLIDTLRNALNHLPHSIAFLVECIVSMKRLVKYFKAEDIDENNVRVDNSSDYAIQVTNGTFSYLKNQTPVIRDINLVVSDGSLTAVVGSVGAGKSTLLSALVGDIHKHRGSVTVKGSVALVSQQAFILNATVRNNILFGKKYSIKRYKQVVEACALISDLDVLPKGDETLIGEKGINLSGGQKQRISLARAVYSDADIYLLDDPLSAVDAHVGKHIFDRVIGPNGLLNMKTRLMVTHGIHWLPLVEEVCVIKEGVIAERGSYDHLLSHKGEFSQFVQTYFTSEVKDSTEGNDEIGDGDALRRKILSRLESVTSITSDTDGETDDDGATQSRQLSKHLSSDKETSGSNVFDDEEEVEMGEVSWKVYLTYFKAVGVFRVAFVVAMIAIDNGLMAYYSIWISNWTGDETFSPTSNATNSERQSLTEKYVAVLAAIGSGSVISTLCYVLGVAVCLYYAGVRLHQTLLNSILKAKMVFFDTKPLGMILNRFSKDVETLDNSVGWSMMGVGVISATVLHSVGGLLYTSPYLIVPVLIMAVFYYYLQKYFICTARQLRRISSKANSPIFAHFSETLNGCQTIRAYHHQERFIQENKEKVENRNIYLYFDSVANGWLHVRMQFLSASMVLICCLFCVTSTHIPFLNTVLSPSIVGLLLSFVFRFTGVLNRMVWATSEMETDIVSVERIKEYSEVEQEPAWTSPHPPAESWPSSGLLRFENYATRYRPGLDLVIKDLTLEIRPQEKVGIVGRTGAGKSSLTLSLFRLIEAAQGNITIDGVNIADVGLHELRNGVTILPQDPILFSGSVRENMDPFGEISDDRLWQVLGQCQLKDFIQSKPGRLSADCGEGGSNLSVGQRQLICLARALLRKTKILIMDEATAAVDLQTDDFIQKTIRREFADCTILTIAHRLNTIIDCDRILVLSHGSIVEFDSPKTLLEDETGMFYSMAKDAGIV